MPDKTHLEELARFIRENRSSESNFDKLFQKLTDEYKAVAEHKSGNGYAEDLQQTLEKHATLYQQNKEKVISTWPEFENFVSHFEVAVTKALS